jgi:multicomponent Na+:H+ antiporter subunit B
MKQVLAVGVAACLAVILLVGLADFPNFGASDNPAHNEVMVKYIEEGPSETGAVNMVSGMILDYRAFDTFVESIVFFTAVISVIAVLKGGQIT